MFGWKLVQKDYLNKLKEDRELAWSLVKERVKLIDHKKALEKDNQKLRERLRKISQVVCGHKD